MSTVLLPEGSCPTPSTFLSPFVPTINPLFEGNVRGSLSPATKRGVSKIGQGLGRWPNLDEKLGQTGEGAAGRDPGGLRLQRPLKEHWFPAPSTAMILFSPRVAEEVGTILCSSQSRKLGLRETGRGAHMPVSGLQDLHVGAQSKVGQTATTGQAGTVIMPTLQTGTPAQRVGVTATSKPQSEQAPSPRFKPRSVCGRLTTTPHCLSPTSP